MSPLIDGLALTPRTLSPASLTTPFSFPDLSSSASSHNAHSDPFRPLNSNFSNTNNHSSIFNPVADTAHRDSCSATNNSTHFAQTDDTDAAHPSNEFDAGVDENVFGGSTTDENDSGMEIDDDAPLLSGAYTYYQGKPTGGSKRTALKGSRYRGRNKKRASPSSSSSARRRGQSDSQGNTLEKLDIGSSVYRSDSNNKSSRSGSRYSGRDYSPRLSSPTGGGGGIYWSSCSRSQKERRKTVRWTDEEVDELKRGVNTFGCGKWAIILRNCRFNHVRTSVDLKDKWRNLTAVRSAQTVGSGRADWGGIDGYGSDEKVLSGILSRRNDSKKARVRKDGSNDMTSPMSPMSPRIVIKEEDQLMEIQEDDGSRVMRQDSIHSYGSSLDNQEQQQGGTEEQMGMEIKVEPSIVHSPRMTSLGQLHSSPVSSPLSALSTASPALAPGGDAEPSKRPSHASGGELIAASELATTAAAVGARTAAGCPTSAVTERIGSTEEMLHNEANVAESILEDCMSSEDNAKVAESILQDCISPERKSLVKQEQGVQEPVPASSELVTANDAKVAESILEDCMPLEGATQDILASNAFPTVAGKAQAALEPPLATITTPPLHVNATRNAGMKVSDLTACTSEIPMVRPIPQVPVLGGHPEAGATAIGRSTERSNLDGPLNVGLAVDSMTGTTSGIDRNSTYYFQNL